MPLAEHPEMRWHEAALYVEAESIPRLMGWLRKLRRGAAAAMVSAAAGVWPRLLHTSLVFGSGWVPRECARCRGGAGRGRAVRSDSGPLLSAVRPTRRPKGREGAGG